MTTICDRLAVLRDKGGLSIGKIARALDKGESEVSRWFSGRVTPGGKNLLALAKVMGITVADITGDVGEHDCYKALGLSDISPITQEEILLVEMHRALDRVGIGREIVALADKILTIKIGKRKK